MAGLCRICGKQAQPGSDLCDIHEAVIFQLETILKNYIASSGSPPAWIVNFMPELDWIFRRNPHAIAFFHVASEILFDFIIDFKDKIEIDEIDELNYTNLPRGRIIKILERAYLIEPRGEYIFPGILSRKLLDIRWEGYEISDIRFANKLREIFGILTVALTKAMLEENVQMPRQALAIFNLLAMLIVREYPNDLVVTETDLRIAFAEITPAQRDRMLRYLLGFSDGYARLFSDAQDEFLILKPKTEIYVNRMRELYRERERGERERTE